MASTKLAMQHCYAHLIIESKLHVNVLSKEISVGSSTYLMKEERRSIKKNDQVLSKMKRQRLETRCISKRNL